MRWFQVSFELKSSEQDYAPFHSYLTKDLKALKVMATSYLLQAKTSETALFKALIPFIDKEDSVLVAEVSRKHAAGRLDENHWEKFQ